MSDNCGRNHKSFDLFILGMICWVLSGLCSYLASIIETKGVSFFFGLSVAAIGIIGVGLIVASLHEKFKE